MERLKELIDRMVAPGPAFAQLSASEGHEIREGCLDLIKQIEALCADLENVLQSATPHPTQHPTMHAAWKRAQATLASIGHPITDHCLN